MPNDSVAHPPFLRAEMEVADAGALAPLVAGLDHDTCVVQRWPDQHQVLLASAVRLLQRLAALDHSDPLAARPNPR